jgi:ABC-type uncharacterized transport system ATPase subunit
MEELEKDFSSRTNLRLEGKRRVLASLNPASLPAAEFVKSVMGRFDVADLTISEPSIEQVIMKIYKDGVPEY